MTNIAIFDEVADDLTQAAVDRGCSREQLASFAIQDWLRQQEVELTPEQDQLIRERLTRPDDGAYMTSEEVDAKFEALFDRLRSR